MKKGGLIILAISIALLAEPIKQQYFKLKDCENVYEMFLFSIPEWDWRRFVKVEKKF